MLTHRRWESLDRADLGWLRAKHHFAVSADGNPAHGALGPLIVWNDDEIAIGSGFPMHGHRDMEIVTYIPLAPIAEAVLHVSAQILCEIAADHRT